MKMMTVTVLTALLVCPVDVQAQQRCAAREHVVNHLAQKYGERRQALGLGGQGAMMEIFASEASGRWTITMPNGSTCLMAMGQNYEALSKSLMRSSHDL